MVNILGSVQKTLSKMSLLLKNYERQRHLIDIGNEINEIINEINMYVNHKEHIPIQEFTNLSWLGRYLDEEAF